MSISRSDLVKQLLAQSAQRIQPAPTDPLGTAGNIFATVIPYLLAQKEADREIALSRDRNAALAALTVKSDARAANIGLDAVPRTGGGEAAPAVPQPTDRPVTTKDTKAAERQSILDLLNADSSGGLSNAVAAQFIKRQFPDLVSLGANATLIDPANPDNPIAKGQDTAEGGIRAQKIAALNALGVGNNDRPGQFGTASDYVDERIKATTSPNTRGDIFVTNTRTNASTKTNVRTDPLTAFITGTDDLSLPEFQPGVSDAAQGAPSLPAVNIPGVPGQPKKRTPVSQMEIAPNLDDEAVQLSQIKIAAIDSALDAALNVTTEVFKKGVGTANVLARFAADGTAILGWNTFSDEVEAKKILLDFNQTGQKGLLNNPKAIDAEVRRILDTFPDPDAYTTTPDREIVRFSETVRLMEQKRATEEAFLTGKQVKLVPRRITGVESDPIPLSDEFSAMSDAELEQVLPKGFWFVTKNRELIFNE